MKNNIYPDRSRTPQQLGHDNGAQQDENRGRFFTRCQSVYWCKNPNEYNEMITKDTKNHDQGVVYKKLGGLYDGGRIPNEQYFNASPSSLSGTASPFVPSNMILSPAAGSPFPQTNTAYQQARNNPPAATSMAAGATELPKAEVKLMQQPAVTTLPGMEGTKPTRCNKHGNNVPLDLEQGAGAARPEEIISNSHRKDAEFADRGAATMPATPILRPISVLGSSKSISFTKEHANKDSILTFVELMTKYLHPDKRDSFEKRISTVLYSLSDQQAILDRKRSVQSAAYFKNYDEERILNQEQMRHQDQVTHCYSLVVRSSGNEKNWHEETVLRHMLKAQKYQEASRSCRDRVEKARLGLQDIDRALTEILAKTQNCLIDAFIEVQNDKLDEPKHVCVLSGAAVKLGLSLDTAVPQTVEEPATHTDQADWSDELKEAISDAAKRTDDAKTLKSPQSHREQLNEFPLTSTFIPPKASGGPFPPNDAGDTTGLTETAEESPITSKTHFVPCGSNLSADAVNRALEGAVRTDSGEIKPNDSVSKGSKDAGDDYSQAGTTKKKQKKKSKSKNKDEGAKGQKEHDVNAIAGTNSPHIAAGETLKNFNAGSSRQSRPNSASGMNRNPVHRRKGSKDTKTSQRVASRSSRPNSAAGYNTIYESGNSVELTEEAARTARTSDIPKAVEESDAGSIARDCHKPTVQTGKTSLETAEAKASSITGMMTAHARKVSYDGSGLGGGKTTTIEEKKWLEDEKKMVMMNEKRTNGEGEDMIVPRSQNRKASPVIETDQQAEHKKSTNDIQPAQNVDKRKHGRKGSTTVPSAGAKVVLQEGANSTHEVKKSVDDKRAQDVVSSKHSRKKKKKSFDNKPATPEKPVMHATQAICQSPSAQKTWAQHLGSSQS